MLSNSFLSKLLALLRTSCSPCIPLVRLPVGIPGNYKF